MSLDESYVQVVHVLYIVTTETTVYYKPNVLWVEELG